MELESDAIRNLPRCPDAPERSIFDNGAGTGPVRKGGQVVMLR